METNTNKVPHYYGDITRVIFVVSAIVILLGLPTVSAIFNIPPMVAAVGVIVLVIAAGVTNPVQRGSLLLNMLISIAGLGIFMYVTWFMHSNAMGGVLAVLNQIIALLFLFATYLSIKSVRGYSLNK